VPSAAALATSPLALKMLGELPPFVRGDPDHQAVQYAYGKELERLEAKIEQVRLQGAPSTATLLLKLWEATVGAEVEPAGIPENERQLIVVAFMRALEANPTGLHWEAVIRLLAGAGWLYITHIHLDAGTPEPNEVHVILPFATASFWFGTVRRLIERITPAHVKLNVTASEGFMLDESELDKGKF
jgi:hypothetical protein